MKNKKYILISVFIVGLIIGSVLFFRKNEQVLAGLAGGTFNLIGSRTGTTTTGAGFYKSPANNGTTSAIANITPEIDAAIFTFKITNASSTPDGIFTYAISGSNDNKCDTATTTTTMADTTVKKDINWYSLGSSVEGKITATGAVATGTVLSLTNLTWKCLNFEANGSSTVGFVQIITKDSD